MTTDNTCTICHNHDTKFEDKICRFCRANHTLPSGKSVSASDVRAELVEVQSTTPAEVTESRFLGGKESCPSCDESFQGDPIPADIAKHYSGTHFKKDVGIEVPGVYDGVLMWKCHACDYTWPRFSEGRLYEQATKIINESMTPAQQVSAMFNEGSLKAFAESDPDNFLDWHAQEYGGQLMEQNIDDLKKDVFVAYAFDGREASLDEWASKHPHITTGFGDKNFFDIWSTQISEEAAMSTGSDDLKERVSNATRTVVDLTKTFSTERLESILEDAAGGFGYSPEGMLANANDHLIGELVFMKNEKDRLEAFLKLAENHVSDASVGELFDIVHDSWD